MVYATQNQGITYVILALDLSIVPRLKEEKESIMALSLRRTLFLVALALVLLAALLSWSISTAHSTVPYHHVSYQSSHMLAIYCLPPPKGC
jgi:hypothetical protein